jgi:hypothetical protein
MDFILSTEHHYSKLQEALCTVVFPELDMHAGSPVAKTMHANDQEKHNGTNQRSPLKYR